MDKTASIDRPVLIILAAGLATRMRGVDKPTLLWTDGRTLLEHQTKTVESLGLLTVAVTRHDTDLGFKVVNPHPELGVAESLKCGLREVRGRYGPCLTGVLLADQPFVTANDIETVLRRFLQRPPGVHALRARYNGVPGHPVFFDAEWDPVVWGLSGDAGLGSAWRMRADTAWVDIAVQGRPDPSFDIDTDEEYHKALSWAR